MAPAQRRSSTACSPKVPTRRPSLDLDLDEEDLVSMPQEDSNHTQATDDETDSDGGDVAAPGARAVHFKMTVKKQFIDTCETYSEEERKACWYTSEEKETNANKREKIVIRMEAGKPEKRSRPYRGLDCWTEKGSKILNVQIARTIDSVMDEQDAQWDDCTDDYKTIAAMCQEVTAVSAQKALHTAFEDEQAAIKVRGTMFDDVNTQTDDESTVGMGSIVAKKRRERRLRKSKKTMEDKQRVKRRSRKENRNQEDAPRIEKKRKEDPPGDMASPSTTKEKVKTKKVKTIKRVPTTEKASGTGKLKKKKRRSVQ
jgi:hypothetical protein